METIAKITKAIATMQKQLAENNVLFDCGYLGGEKQIKQAEIFSECAAKLRGIIVEIPEGLMHVAKKITVNGEPVSKVVQYGKYEMIEPVSDEIEFFYDKWMYPTYSKLLNAGVYALDEKGKLPVAANNQEVRGYSETQYFIGEIEK